MLGRKLLWRHVAVGVVVLVFGILGFAGVIGAGHHPERFDAKTVFVQPTDAGGVRITEVVDQDFGSADRHGYQRIIPGDFGVPTDIEASSPDANADVHVIPGSFDTTIRLGDANETVSGQHRYVLAYTLPDAQLGSGELALDIIGNDETLETGSFTVVVVGMELTDPTCNVGSIGEVGGCTLAPDGDTLRTTIAPLRPGQGITIGGTITGLDPDAVLPAFPAPPAQRTTNHLAVGLILLGTGLLAAAMVFFVIRRLGRNEVAAGGAADAAYAGGEGPVRLVPDDQMARLATTEFVPPKGTSPWQGNVLLREEIGTESVSAWMSEWIAKEALEITGTAGHQRLRRGARFDQADAAAKPLLNQLTSGGEVALGSYDKTFASAWIKVKHTQQAAIGQSGWWRRMPPGGSGGAGMTDIGRLVGIIVVFAVFAGGGVLRSDVLASAAVAVTICVLVVGGLAAALYWFMLRSRSATGSGLAIRTESFRRFLAASEGEHVDWAWQHGVLREYSAWAVALGAADAWGRALANSHVPPAEVNVGNPLIVASMMHSFSSTATVPQSSGGGGGGGGGGFSGGFSGGSVGGGGGGGSSGSW